MPRTTSVGPEIDYHANEYLNPGICSPQIRIPSTWADAQFFFEKICDQKCLGFSAS
jgi:hypothetical protein